MADQPDVFNPNCASRRALALIADKWSVLVIYALQRGTLRYSELHRMIGGISQKMLTQTLRELEREGLVQRTVYPVVPPMVEYTLTALGETLRELTEALCRWSEAHIGELSGEGSDQSPPNP